MKIKKQGDIKDCGLIVIQAFYKFYYNEWISISDLKKDALYSEEGIVIQNLENLAFKWGLNLETLQGDFESLKKLKLDKPIILLIKENSIFYHYVILEKITNKYFLIHDPLQGKRRVDFDNLKSIYQNVICIVDKNQNYVKPDFENKKNILLKSLNNKKIYPLLISMFFTNGVSFLSSFFFKIVVDKVLPFQNLKLLWILFLVFSWFLVFKFIQEIIKNIYIKKIQMQIEKETFDKFFLSLKLGDNFLLNKLETNDYLRRVNLINSYANFASNFVFTIFNELFSFIISFFILLWIDWKLFSIILIFGIIFFFLSFFYKKFIIKEYDLLIIKNLENQTGIYDLIFSRQEIKENFTFQHLKSKFETNYENYKNQDYKIWKKNFSYKNIHNLFSSFIPLIIILISSFMIFDNKLTLGNMLLFVTFFGFFINPINSFVELFAFLPAFLKEAELLEFVLSINLEKSNETKFKKIENLSFKNFSYSSNGIHKNLNIKNFAINQNIHLIGKNGSGKTTLLKILNQNIQGVGEFKINNLNYDFVNKNFLREKIIFLHSDIHFFKSSILNFITYNDKKLKENFINNIIKYDLEKLFLNWNIDLQKNLINNGANLSQGQKQIILLLRLLTRQYDLILIDEILENIFLDNLELLKTIIRDFQKEAIFVEVSHSLKYISEGKEVNIEKI